MPRFNILDPDFAAKTAAYKALQAQQEAERAEREKSFRTVSFEDLQGTWSVSFQKVDDKWVPVDVTEHIKTYSDGRFHSVRGSSYALTDYWAVRAIDIATRRYMS